MQQEGLDCGVAGHAEDGCGCLFEAAGVVRMEGWKGRRAGGVGTGKER